MTAANNNLEVENIFSSDDAAFFQSMMSLPNDENTRMYGNTAVPSIAPFENPSMYDPPSKVCGGALVAKFMERKHNKQKKREQSFESKHLPLKSNHNRGGTNDHQRQQVEKSSKQLIARLTQKIMKRKSSPIIQKDSFRSTAETTQASFSNREHPREEHPNIDTTMSPAGSLSSLSLSNPSTLDWSSMASPWDDEDFNATLDDLFEYDEDHETPGVIYNGVNYNDDDEAHSVASSSMGNLGRLLKEMKKMNNMVQENSNVLQMGIENIAHELKHKKGAVASTSKPVLSTSSDPLLTKEMEQLKRERTYYQSEAETLRLEMEAIREQMNELRRYLPQNSLTLTPPIIEEEVLSVESGVPPIPDHVEETIQPEKSKKSLRNRVESTDQPEESGKSLKDRASYTVSPSFHSEINEILSLSERQKRTTQARAIRQRRTQKARTSPTVSPTRSQSSTRRTTMSVKRRPPASPKATISTPKSTVDRWESNKTKSIPMRSVSPMARMRKSKIQEHLAPAKKADNFKKNYARSASPMARMRESRNEKEAKESQSQTKKENNYAMAKSFYKDFWESKEKQNSQAQSFNKDHWEGDAKQIGASWENDRSRSMRMQKNRYNDKTIPTIDELDVKLDDEINEVIAQARNNFIQLEEKIKKNNEDSYLVELRTSDSVSTAPADNRTKSNDDEYLAGLRKSWFEKRGLVTANNTASEF